METPPAWRPPDPFPLPLEADRLIVDWWRETDAEALFAAIDAHRVSLAAWLPWPRSDHEDVQETLDRIRAWRRARGRAHTDDFGMGIFEKGTRGVLGGTGLHRIDADRGTAEVGYWVRPDRQLEGLCTEAVGVLVTSAFSDWGLRRIRIVCEAANVASTRVALRLGFRLEAHYREASWRAGHGWSDDLCFALLAGEWDAVNRRGPAVGDG